MNPKRYLVYGLAFLSLSVSHAQVSGPMYSRSAVLAGNNVKTIFGNWGVIGQPMGVWPRGAWRYETNGYIGDLSFLVGVELPIRDYNNDGNPDTIHSFITCPVSRPALSQDTDPITGAWWTFMPIATSINAASSLPPLSTDPSSWPAAWTDSLSRPAWKGLYGMGTVVGDAEAYFELDDRADERYNSALSNHRGVSFHPDTSDLTRTGHGISVACRYIELTHPLFSDILFEVFDISNESDFTYRDLVLGQLVGTYVGVTGNTASGNEYDDDASMISLADNLITTWDFPNDNSRNPSWVGAVGRLGVTFVQSPNKNRIASFDYFSPSGSIPLGDDESLWKMFLSGFYHRSATSGNDTIPPYGDDADYTFGTDHFSLAPGETKQIAAVIVYGMTNSELVQKAALAEVLWNNRFTLSALHSAVSLQGFCAYRVIGDEETIRWQSPIAQGTAELWYSPDAGRNWELIARDVPNSGSYVWHTSTARDGAFCSLRIFVKDAEGRRVGYDESSSYFAVNNPGNAVPSITIVDQFRADQEVSVPELDLHVLAGDAEGAPVTMNVWYQAVANEEWALADSASVPSDTSARILSIPLKSFPNSRSFRIRVEATDGTLFASDATESFIKNTPRRVVQMPNVDNSKRHADVPIEIHVLDANRLTSDRYTLTFKEKLPGDSTSVSVYDETEGMLVARDVPVIPFTETPGFDGLALYTEDAPTVPDTGRSHWGKTTTRNFAFSASFIRVPGIPAYRSPNDYIITFHDHVVDTTLAIADLSPVPDNVLCVNAETGEKLPHLDIRDQENGPFNLYLFERLDTSLVLTWSVYISHHDSLSFPSPTEGDTLYLFTRKGVSRRDTLVVFGDVMGTGPSPGVPTRFSLAQNYPNPFNPSTTISFELPAKVFVNLRIFDLLGREVATLVSAPMTPGNHSIQWNAGGKASGVYFYQLSAGNFTQTKKLLLLR